MLARAVLLLSFLAARGEWRRAEAAERCYAKAGAYMYLTSSLPPGRIEAKTSAATSTATSILTAPLAVSGMWASPDHVHSIPLLQSPLPAVKEESTVTVWRMLTAALIVLSGLLGGIATILARMLFSEKTVPADAHLWSCQTCGKIGATARSPEVEEVEHFLATGCKGRVVECAKRIEVNS